MDVVSKRDVYQIGAYFENDFAINAYPFPYQLEFSSLSDSYNDIAND